MINSLNEKQKALLEIFSEKWIKIGRSTKDYNHQEIESTISNIYSEINLPKPEIYHFESPLSMIYGINIFKNLKEKNINITKKNIKKEIKVLKDINYSLDFCYGSSDAHWIGFYDYFYSVLKIPGTEKIRHLVEMSKTNWWAPFEKYCFISRNPISLIFNEDNQLSCENGPAIEFKDGFKIFSINDFLVPEKVVLNPKKQTIDEILNENNIEVKRIRIERYGWSDFLNKIGAKPIDSSLNLNHGASKWLETLYDVKKYLDCNVLVTCDPSTARVYFLEVDSNCKNCEQAQRYILSPDNIFKGFKNFKIPKLNSYPKLRT